MPKKSRAVSAEAPAYTSTLSINKMRLSVHLGCEKPERITPQAVEVDITFFFPTLTKVSFKDKGDFICYDITSNLVKDLCDTKEFRFIEFLGAEIYRAVRATVAPEIKISVKVTKCGVPVSFVLGGASFTYSDLPPFSWVIPG